MSNIRLENLSKSFEDTIAIDDLSLEVGDGELFVVVGPNGCGKTTLLRLIAGVVRPDRGRIYIEDKVVNEMEPSERGVRMVFEDYALYPHMKVYNEEQFSNLSFPLKIQEYAKGKIKRILKRVTDKIGIENDLFDRKPDQLSGGEKQKVAIGRAVTLPPKVFLMDEPLKNLDPPTRLKARSEIRKVHEELNTTTVYVTHNLPEAMEMADRLAVMREGTIQQVDSPENICKNPKNKFVSDFIESYRLSIPEVLDWD